MNADTLPAERYRELPLDEFTVRDLTDAAGISVAATLLNTTRGSIYTQRQAGMSIERRIRLIEYVRENEQKCRLRLFLTRKLDSEKQNEPGIQLTR